MDTLTNENKELLQALKESAESLTLTHLARANLNSLISDFIYVRDALTIIGGNSNASYSIAGRSFTGRNVDELQKRCDALVRCISGYMPEASQLATASASRCFGIDFAGGANV